MLDFEADDVTDVDWNLLVGVIAKTGNTDGDSASVGLRDPDFGSTGVDIEQSDTGDVSWAIKKELNLSTLLEVLGNSSRIILDDEDKTLRIAVCTGSSRPSTGSLSRAWRGALGVWASELSVGSGVGGIE